MHPAEPDPLSAVVVTPSANGQEAEVLDLRQTDRVYSAPIAGDGRQTSDGMAPDVPLLGGDTGANAGAAIAPTERGLVQDSSSGGELFADMALLVPLKESEEYQGLSRQVTRPEPVDSWQEDNLHFFVFHLEVASKVDTTSVGPVAVFAMHPAERAPVSAVVVTPGVNGEEAEVLDVRRPENAYMVQGAF